MKRGILVATLIASLTLTVPAFAAGGGGQGKGQGVQSQTRSMNQTQKQQRLRDGSCTQSGTSQGTKNKAGNAYGPGDGTGNQGVGPRDGTGYGTPVNR
jgi:hypothetical protein